MRQRIQELEEEYDIEGTMNQRADMGEEYMVEDSEISPDQSRSANVKKRTRFLGQENNADGSMDFGTENDFTSNMDWF